MVNGKLRKLLRNPRGGFADQQEIHANGTLLLHILEERRLIDPLHEPIDLGCGVLHPLKIDNQLFGTHERATSRE